MNNDHNKGLRMQHKKLKFSVVLLLGLGLTELHAQTMYVKEISGAQTAYTLSNMRKISFSSGNLTVTKTDNISNVYALGALRYLNFSDNTTIFNEPLSIQSQKLKVYPNPVSDILNIDLTGMVETIGILSILSFEGKTLVSQQVNNKDVISLDISHLPAGIYLCRYSNATEIKIVKIIKQ